MQWKKWSALLLSACLLFSLAACNTPKDSDGSGTSADDPSSRAESTADSADSSDGADSTDGTSGSGATESTSSGGSTRNPGNNGTTGTTAPPIPVINVKGNGPTADLTGKDVQTKGKTGVTTVTSSLWGTKRSCRTMTGKNSELSFAFTGLTAGKDATIELEEVHLRDDKVFAYSVYVNGTEVYFRSYAPSSDNNVNYYIPVPGSLIGKDGKATVTLRNYGDAVVRFHRAWAFSDMDSMLAGEKVARKMKVLLLSPKLTKNSKTDTQTLKSLLKDFNGGNMYEVGFATEVSYLSSGTESLHNTVDYLMELSSLTGAPYHIGLNSWWSGTPSGPDGKGGLFSDITYHQVVYDPLNINGRGKWQLSTPNRWSNVPWLTMNNAALNAARKTRLEEITRHISDKMGEYAAAGKTLPKIGLYLENEPIYWPYSAFEESPEGGADFNAATIAAAKKDGVTLDPTNGLSMQEKLWMLKNLHTYIAGEGESVEKGLQYNSVLVKGSSVTLPTSQLVENSFTHSVLSTYPLYDSSHGSWETHMLDTIRTGLEYADALSDPRPLDYVSAQGRYGDVNAERGSMSDYGVISQAFAYGADHVTIYNFKNTDSGHLTSENATYKDTASVKGYHTELFSYNFEKSGSEKKNSVLVEATDVERTSYSSSYVVAPSNTFGKGGYVMFKLQLDKAPTNGLIVEMDGRIITSMAARMRMRLYVSNNADDLKGAYNEIDDKFLVKELKTLDSDQFDISNYIDRSKKTVYIRVHMAATGGLRSWCALKSIKVYSPWGRTTGSTVGMTYTNLQMRNRYLFTQYRADAARLLENYVSRGGKDSIYTQAKKLYDANKYVSAYNLLTGNISQTLPANYTVAGSAKLGKYGLTVNLNNSSATAAVQLQKASKTGYTFTLSPSNTVKVTLTAEVDAGTYALTVKNGVYTIQKASSGTKASGGKVTLTVNVAKPTQDLPSSFEAQAAATGTASALKVLAQDPAVSEYANTATLTVAANCKVYLGNAGDPDSALKSVTPASIQLGDYLKIKTDDRNKVVEVKAYRGNVTGTVKAVKQIFNNGVAANPTVTVEAGGKTYTFEIGGDCVLEYEGATGDRVKLCMPNDLGIKVGQKLTIRYCPWSYNGGNMRAVRIS